MRISRKVLSLPPYISTSWKNVISLVLEERAFGPILIIELQGGAKVEVPGLDQALIAEIFDVHSKCLEEEESKSEEISPRREEIPFLRIGTNLGGLDTIGSVMHHNPQQKDAPNLPPEILSKITNIAKVLGIDDPHTLPKAEPHCNCVHCQIARAMHNQNRHEEHLEEEIKDEDLKFRIWDVKQAGEKLYTVCNPSDEKEVYNVFLGDPIGCTCGQNNCEHIRAVLNT